MTVRVNSRPKWISAVFLSGTTVFAEVVMPAGASSGTASKDGMASKWSCLDVNRNDSVEMALAANLQKAALAHVTASLCKTYTGQWNMFER